MSRFASLFQTKSTVDTESMELNYASRVLSVERKRKAPPPTLREALMRAKIHRKAQNQVEISGEKACWNLPPPQPVFDAPCKEEIGAQNKALEEVLFKSKPNAPLDFEDDSDDLDLSQFMPPHLVIRKC